MQRFYKLLLQLRNCLIAHVQIENGKHTFMMNTKYDSLPWNNFIRIDCHLLGLQKVSSYAIDQIRHEWFYEVICPFHSIR